MYSNKEIIAMWAYFLDNASFNAKMQTDVHPKNIVTEWDGLDIDEPNTVIQCSGYEEAANVTDEAWDKLKNSEKEGI